MKKWIFIICFLALCGYSEIYAQVSFGHSRLINDGWKFIEADIIPAASAVYDDSAWEDVDIPHDWSVKGTPSEDNPSCMGYLKGGIGTYRKTLHIGEETRGQKQYIYFEGVYNRSTVWMNGHCLGSRPNGYVSFMYDVTPYINYGEDNHITVRVDHSHAADSRWYTGSGIYRNVWLVESSPVHIAQWGVYAVPKYDNSSKSWTLDVQTELCNETERTSELTVKHELVSSAGKVVARSGSSLNVNASESAVHESQLKIENPSLWNLASPELYVLKTSVYNGKKIVDRAETKTGFRSLDFDPDKGFFLNGRNIKVKGVCLHHDAGVLGAAVPEQVWRVRLNKLKEIGCNAIRTTHNPQSPAFYDLCDELGLLVMNEAFDEWEFAKRKWVDGWNIGTPEYYGSYDFFEEWGEIDLADMVRRDRNHPCVFAWSIGNEVDYPNDPYSHPILNGDDSNGFSQPIFGGYNPDAPNAERLGAIAQRLAAVVRSLDPSRPVTAGLAGVAMSNETSYPSALDIAGYNYTESRYGSDHVKYPERVIFGSENRHDYHAWKAVRDNEHIFGQFLWTGIDYLGESNAWPSRGFGSGLIDLAGNMKSLGWYRASLWTEKPFARICTHAGEGDPIYVGTDSWNYRKGENVAVVCYTNCSSAELYLNGKTVGECKDFDDEKGYIWWNIPFSEGKLKVVAKDASGKEAAAHLLNTHGEAVSFEVSSVRSGDMSIVSVQLVDKKGVPVLDSERIVNVGLEGDAILLGVESGDNTDMSAFDGSNRKLFNGRLVVYAKHLSDDVAEITIESENIPVKKLHLRK